jgi:hypothetical protein
MQAKRAILYFRVGKSKSLMVNDLSAAHALITFMTDVVERKSVIGRKQPCVRGF